MDESTARQESLLGEALHRSVPQLTGSADLAARTLQARQRRAAQRLVGGAVAAVMLGGVGTVMAVADGRVSKPPTSPSAATCPAPNADYSPPPPLRPGGDEHLVPGEPLVVTVCHYQQVLEDHMTNGGNVQTYLRATRALSGADLTAFAARLNTLTTAGIPWNDGAKSCPAPDLPLDFGALIFRYASGPDVTIRVTGKNLCDYDKLMTSTIWAHATVDWMNLTVTPQDPPVQAPPPSGVWPTSPSPVPVTDTSQITAPVVPRPSPVGTTPMPTR